MTAPDRPAVTEEIQRWEPIAVYIGMSDYAAELVASEDGEAVLYTDHVAALAACVSQSKSRLARYDEAVRLLRECVSVLGDAATTKESDWLEEMHGTICALGEASEAFLAAEPKTEERNG